MVKKERKKGLIKLKQEELQRIKQEIDEVSERMHNCFEQARTIHQNGLGDLSAVKQANELEEQGHFYSNQIDRLDRLRIAALNKIDELQEEANRLKSAIAANERHKVYLANELERLKREYEMQVQSIKEDMEVADDLIEQQRLELLELEGEVQ
jgi:chromosome segregation ATPase